MGSKINLNSTIKIRGVLRKSSYSALTYKAGTTGCNNLTLHEDNALFCRLKSFGMDRCGRGRGATTGLSAVACCSLNSVVENVSGAVKYQQLSDWADQAERMSHTHLAQVVAIPTSIILRNNDLSVRLGSVNFSILSDAGFTNAAQTDTSVVQRKQQESCRLAGDSKHIKNTIMITAANKRSVFTLFSILFRF
jgi:hypothetical protein